MADRFMISIDGVIINNNITSFRVALAMLFSAYYIFNIQYPSDAEATLEFIQRYVFIAVRTFLSQKYHISSIVV